MAKITNLNAIIETKSNVYKYLNEACVEVVEIRGRTVTCSVPKEDDRDSYVFVDFTLDEIDQFVDLKMPTITLLGTAFEESRLLIHGDNLENVPFDYDVIIYAKESRQSESGIRGKVRLSNASKIKIDRGMIVIESNRFSNDSNFFNYARIYKLCWIDKIEIIKAPAFDKQFFNN